MTNQDQKREPMPGQRQQEQGMPNKEQHGGRDPGQPSRQQEQGETRRPQPGQQNENREQQR